MTLAQLIAHLASLAVGVYEGIAGAKKKKAKRVSEILPPGEKTASEKAKDERKKR